MYLHLPHPGLGRAAELIHHGRLHRIAGHHQVADRVEGLGQVFHLRDMHHVREGKLPQPLNSQDLPPPTLLINSLKATDGI